MLDEQGFDPDSDLEGLDLGASAKSIIAWFAGNGVQRGDYPTDAGDFARCEALLDRFPAWRDRLGDMDKLNAYWAELSRAWPKLRRKKGEELTKAIRAIIDPIHAVDPAYVDFMPGASMRVGDVRFSHRDYLEALARREAKPKTADSAAQLIQKALRERDGARRAARGVPPLKPDTEFDAMASDAYNVTAEELRSFIERFEHLAQEKADIADQMKEVMAEAKGRGYDTKVLRRIIALRKRKPDDVAEEEAVLELYKTALGMA